MIRIAIDTGGTFTDCVYLDRDRGGLRVLKVFSTPANPAEAILNAVGQIAGRSRVEIRHGTTVGTNTLLERKGARTGFVTTEGFEDTIAIGRQSRPRLYDFFASPEPPLAPHAWRWGVAERTLHDGSILKRPTEAGLEQLANAIHASGVESVAVSLLFSFANPANERAVAAALLALGIPISLSHRILPEFREYERASTVLVNAYLAPKMGSYLASLQSAVGNPKSTIEVMQSSGGIVSARIAAAEPVRTILSGPAGGVVGAHAIARLAGFERIISLDMGGTSTDVALVEGEPHTTSESLVAGLPVAVPMLDIHTVGAGGGSLARFDSGGVLRVGPQSAGADPGPICYGRGAGPTVTDANLLLGRLDPDIFLGGQMKLDAERAREFCRRAKGSVATVEEFAAGIVRLAEATMEKAIRVISVERGHDPRDYTLVSFGGAGGLHACSLARALRIPRVLVPVFPGALSALGIWMSDVISDRSRTVMLAPDSPDLERHFRDLEERRRGELAVPSVDVRYVGQGYEINVPWGRGFLKAFHEAHRRRYGYADAARPTEVVNVRVRIIARAQPVKLPRRPLGRGDGRQAVLRSRPVIFDGRTMATKVYDRGQLRPGDSFAGPAIVAEYSATSVIPPGWKARVDGYGNLIAASAR
jgi:N-methylhydantoinase A